MFTSAWDHNKGSTRIFGLLVPTSFPTVDALIKDLHYKAEDQEEMMAGAFNAIERMNATPRVDPASQRRLSDFIGALVRVRS